MSASDHYYAACADAPRTWPTLAETLIDITRHQYPVNADALNDALIQRLTMARWNLHSALLLVPPASEERRQIEAARDGIVATLKLLGEAA